jgi:uncharacterized protein
MYGRLTFMMPFVASAAIACGAGQPAGSRANNVTLVRGLYDSFARGDVPAVLAALDSTVEWRAAEGMLYADRSPYIGPNAVAQGVFQRIVSDVDSLAVVPQSFIDAGDIVVVEGRYKGKVRATGVRVDAQFAHVYHLRNGKVIRLQQYTDTRQWASAVARQPR